MTKTIEERDLLGRVRKSMFFGGILSHERKFQVIRDGLELGFVFAWNQLRAQEDVQKLGEVKVELIDE